MFPNFSDFRGNSAFTIYKYKLKNTTFKFSIFYLITAFEINRRDSGVSYIKDESKKKRKGNGRREGGRGEGGLNAQYTHLPIPMRSVRHSIKLTSQFDPILEAKLRTNKRTKSMKNKQKAKERRERKAKLGISGILAGGRRWPIGRRFSRLLARRTMDWIGWVHPSIPLLPSPSSQPTLAKCEINYTQFPREKTEKRLSTRRGKQPVIFVKKYGKDDD